MVTKIKQFDDRMNVISDNDMNHKKAAINTLEVYLRLTQNQLIITLTNQLIKLFFS